MLRLTQELFLEEGRMRNPDSERSVDDGVKAMAYLRGMGEYKNSKKPDVVLLDLNTSKERWARRCWQEIKADPEAQGIPVVILTGSQAEEDVF